MNDGRGKVFQEENKGCIKFCLIFNYILQFGIPLTPKLDKKMLQEAPDLRCRNEVFKGCVNCEKELKIYPNGDGETLRI